MECPLLEVSLYYYMPGKLGHAHMPTHSSNVQVLKRDTIRYHAQYLVHASQVKIKDSDSVKVEPLIKDTPY